MADAGAAAARFLQCRRIQPRATPSSSAIPTRRYTVYAFHRGRPIVACGLSWWALRQQAMIGIPGVGAAHHLARRRLLGSTAISPAAPTPWARSSPSPYSPSASPASQLGADSGRSPLFLRRRPCCAAVGRYSARRLRTGAAAVPDTPSPPRRPRGGRRISTAAHRDPRHRPSDHREAPPRTAARRRGTSGRPRPAAGRRHPGGLRTRLAGQPRSLPHGPGRARAAKPSPGRRQPGGADRRPLERAGARAGGGPRQDDRVTSRRP